MVDSGIPGDVTPAPRTKESNLLNVGFGVLNPIGETIVGKNFTPHNVSSLDAVRKSTIDHFSERVLQTSGHFIGIVLRVDGSLREGAIDPSHWAVTSNLLIKKGDQSSVPDLLQIRVRIPELHAHLPIPEWLPNPDETSRPAKEAHDIINMYPSFVAASELLTSRGAPDRGTLVWVDFQNRSNFSGPTYYDKVHDTTQFNTGEEDGLASEADTSSSDRADPSQYVPEYYDNTTTVVLSGGYPTRKSKSYSSSLRENRVRFYAYGDLKQTPGASNNLVQLPSNMTTKANLKVHSLLLTRLVLLNDLWSEYYETFGLSKKKIPAGAPGAGKAYTNSLKIRSAHRKSKYSFAIGDASFNNDNYCPGLKKYCADARSGKSAGLKHPPRSCRSNLGKIAFMSPHMTGLCVDFGNNGLSTDSRKTSAMRKTETWKFLVDYGWLFGLYPYATESWHFELLVPRENWFNGEEFIDPTGATYPVVETHKVGTDNINDKISNNGLKETYPLQGERYDWIAGRQFPYAVWVEEYVNALSTDSYKVYTTNPGSFTVKYKVGTPGKEYFTNTDLAIRYLTFAES